MNQVLTFSTAGLAPYQRVAYWNQLAGQEIARLSADPLDAQSFAGELTRMQLGRLRVVSVLSAPATVRRSPQHISQSREELYFLVLQLEGSSFLQQRGREATLGPGDFTLFDSSLPYEVRFRDLNRALILCIPRDELCWRVPATETLSGLPMRSETSLAHITSSFLCSLWRQICEHPEVPLAPRMGSALLDVVTSAYEAAFPHSARHTPRTRIRREQLKSYIETHLRDPGLCPERIAQAAHMSVRYLHRLFSDSGESVAHYILRRRLEECSRAFRDAAQREQTIKTLALRHGFNDVTHFGRVFRAHFGMTPGSYRFRSEDKRENGDGL